MDSRLDSLFRAGFRPAEKTDTWQGIRREEQTDAHKKKDQQPKEKSEESFNDDTVLSVQSLHGVLSMLLQQAGEPVSPAGTPVSAAVPETAAPPGPQAQRASYAASAYQTTARTSARDSHFSFSDGPPQVPTGPSLTLSAAELRSIHALLQDVETLARRGVTTITLRGAESFLQSLTDSVREALGD